MLVDQMQHDHALGVAHAFGADRFRLGLVEPAKLLGELVREALPVQPGRVQTLALLPEEAGDVGAEPRDVPGVGVRPLRAALLDEAAHRVPDQAEDAHPLVLAVQHLAAQAVDGLALLVHHVVVLENVLAGLEVLGLDRLLRRLDALRDQARLDGHVLLHAELEHQRLHAVAAEDAHQVVLEGQVEARRPGVALAARPAPQLVVDATRLVALGAEHVQAAQVHHLVVLAVGRPLELRQRLPPGLRVVGVVGVDALPPQRLAGQELGVAAEQDVGAAAGHVGRDRDRPLAPRLGDDVRFALVVLGVQHLVRNAQPPQPPGQELGLLDRDRADEDRLAALLALLEVVGGVPPLLLGGAVDDVLVLEAHHGTVRRDHDDVELVDLRELRRLRVRRARHSGQLPVHPEVVLEGHRGERLVLALDADALLRLHGLVQAVRPAPSRHQPARELVHDDDLAVLDDVVLVPLEHHVRLEALLDGVLGVVVGELVDVVDAERLLDPGLALLGQPRGPVLLLEDVVSGVGALPRLVALDGLALAEPGNHPVGLVVLVGRDLGGSGDDQGRPGLVDQDGVDLVHDREVVPALDMLAGLELHVVAQIVEPELVVRPVGDVRGVGLAALDVVESVDDHPDAHSEPAVDPAHPLGVALGQIVVDGDHVHPAAGDCVEVHGEGRGEGLALAGLHLGDPALVQDDAADQLDVEVAHLQDAPGRLPADGERLGEQVVQGLAVGVPALELSGLGLELVVRERLRLGAEGVDPLDDRLEPLDLALMLGSEDLG